MKKIDDFKKKLDKIASIGTDEKFLRRVGQKLELQIRERVRQGLGTSAANTEPNQFAPLRPTTIRARKRKKLHPRTFPSKSNLTETGQMMDSLQHKAANGKLEINFKTLKRLKSNVTDGALANLHQYGARNLPARPFINPSKKEFEGIVDQLISEVVKVFKS